MAKKVIHRAESRGHANHGWLDTHHTFSFANYYDPERVHFGALRVLNDDVVTGGMGFGTHPHDNMEIISIPIEGDLEHKDSMGNTQVIRQNDVQIMSAGTGIMHSEKNKNPDQPVNFLQIWVFPKERDIKPRYDQKTYLPEDRVNRLQRVVAPDDEAAVWINQDAWFSLGRLEAGHQETYAPARAGNGIYVFLISGKITVDGESLNHRDGMGIWESDGITLEAQEESEVLIMDLPMELN